MIRTFRRGMIKFRSFVIECKRVFKVTKKPDMQEFKTVSKVSAIGAAVIGALGFLVHIIYQLMS